MPAPLLWFTGLDYAGKVLRSIYVIGKSRGSCVRNGMTD